MKEAKEAKEAKEENNRRRCLGSVIYERTNEEISVRILACVQVVHAAILGPLVSKHLDQRV